MCASIAARGNAARVEATGREARSLQGGTAGDGAPTKGRERCSVKRGKGAGHEMHSAKGPTHRGEPDGVESTRTEETGHSVSFEAVQWSVRSRGDNQQLAMCFDPGESTHLIHTDHAIDLLWRLLHLRGWRDDAQPVKLGLAQGWHDVWWTRTVASARYPVLQPGMAVDERAGAESEQVEELALEQSGDAETGGEDAGPGASARPCTCSVRSASRRAGR